MRPGGEILLRVDNWPKVERVLQAIDAVEALDIDPVDAAPEYWHHLHNRLAAGHEPRAFTQARSTRPGFCVGRRSHDALRLGHGDLFFCDGDHGAAFMHPPPKLIWNASASVPIGLYALRPIGPLRHRTRRRGAAGADRELPQPGRFPAPGRTPDEAFMARPGQTVCRAGMHITIDTVEVGDAQAHDREDAICLFGPAAKPSRPARSSHEPGRPDSLDGRYFGVLPASSIIGRAAPVWTDEAGDGRFVSRAAAN